MGKLPTGSPGTRSGVSGNPRSTRIARASGLPEPQWPPSGGDDRWKPCPKLSPAVAEQGEGRLARRKLVRLLSPSGLSGSYDFKPGTAADLSDMFGHPEDFALSQPIHYVDGSNPPMLLMHGRDDNAVNVENTINLGNAVERAGGQVKTVLYPELGHGLMVASLASYYRMRPDHLRR